MGVILHHGIIIIHYLQISTKCCLHIADCNIDTRLTKEEKVAAHLADPTFSQCGSEFQCSGWNPIIHAWVQSEHLPSVNLFVFLM